MQKINDDKLKLQPLMLRHINNVVGLCPALCMILPSPSMKNNEQPFFQLVAGRVPTKPITLAMLNFTNQAHNLLLKIYVCLSSTQPQPTGLQLI